MNHIRYESLYLDSDIPAIFVLQIHSSEVKALKVTVPVTFVEVSLRLKIYLHI